ncbi:MAG: hypothetical protein ACRYHQ_14785 [Janthinobacterium lividum]
MDAAALARGDRAADGCQHLGGARERVVEKWGFSWRQPRHSLTGRQDRNAVERMGVRLRLRQAQADAGDVVLLYADESEALTHPYLAHAWAERGADLRVQARGASRKVAVSGEPLGSTLGVLDAGTGELIVSTSPPRPAPTSSPCCAGWTGATAPDPAAHACPWSWCWTTGPSTLGRVLN